MFRFTPLFIIALFIFGFSLTVPAQFDVSTRNGQKKEEPLPQNIKETLEKQKIEESKKEYDELLERGKQAVKMSEEIELSFSKNNKLTPKDQAKLKNLEKLLKKIRKDLGGDDDDDEVKSEKPDSTKNAIEILKRSTLNLFEEIKKTTRFSISAIAIESSNAILKLVKFLRFNN